MSRGRRYMLLGITAITMAGRAAAQSQPSWVDLRNTGQYDLALKSVSAEIELAPSNPANYNGRGTIFYMMGDYSSAIKDFNRAFELGEQPHAVLYVNRGFAYLMVALKNSNARGYFGQAMTDFNQAISIEPDYARAYYGIGYLCEQSGYNQDAARYYQYALDRDHDHKLKVTPEQIARLAGMPQMRAYAPSPEAPVLPPLEDSVARAPAR